MALQKFIHHIQIVYGGNPLFGKQIVWLSDILEFTAANEIERISSSANFEKPLT